MSPAVAGTDRRGLAITAFFAVVIFASAFLIFLVQPMVGKRILPWFGGAPAVWTLCLAFYQTTLFVGYAYAHLLIRHASPKLQLAIHAVLLLCAMAILPVLPADGWKPDGAADPASSIVAMLSANVALPFLMLAATGPLVQAWFARRQPGRSPYPLYAVSNAGSLVALLGYPFVLEPALPLSTADHLWSLAFGITGVAVMACAWLASRPDLEESSLPDPPAPIAVRSRPVHVSLWILLPGCAVILLMGVTNELCLDLASVPFLWILPLSVYLVTFILCFGSDRFYRRAPYVLLALVPIAGAPLIGAQGSPDGAIALITGTIQAKIALFSLMLFSVCMVLHGELHRLRPPAHSLTTFYLCLSGGGALGGLFVGIVAPRIFDDYHELQLGLSLALILLLFACWNDTRGWLHRGVSRWRWAVVLAITPVLLGGWAAQSFMRGDDVVLQERTFFGVLRVLERGSDRSARRQLFNGTTLHGTQYLAWEKRPTSYFGMQTGIGLALTHREPGVDTNIGIVGLGIGTLAAYGRLGDRIRFYEIDPAVSRISQDDEYFTYVPRSLAEVSVVEGDARIALAAELDRKREPPFDVLIIDAFSSDAIPVHLLTREAIRLYFESMSDDGLLAIHASSQHLDLAPLIARMGESEGLHVLGIQNERMPRHLSKESLWMMLSRDPERIRSLERLAQTRSGQLGLPTGTISPFRATAVQLRDSPLWTDDYSDLFGVMRPVPIRFGGE